MVVYSLITLFCCFLYGVSAVLCKVGLQHDIAANQYASRWMFILSLMTNRVWVIGVALSAFANVVMVQVQSVIDVSVVYPILNFSYIFALVLGYLYLKEMLNKAQWIGVATVVLGTVVMLFIKDPVTGNMTDIQYLKVITLISMGSIAILIAFAIRYKPLSYEIVYAICAGIAFGNVETYLKTNTNLVTSEIGYFSVLSWESLHQFMTLWPFLMVIFFSIIGFVCMQIAFSHGNVSVSVPLVAVTQRPVTMSSGYLIFGEQFPVTKLMGIAVILIGVFILILASLNTEEEAIAG